LGLWVGGWRGRCFLKRVVCERNWVAEPHGVVVRPGVLGLKVAVPGLLAAIAPFVAVVPCVAVSESCGAFEETATQGRNRRWGIVARHRNQQGLKSFCTRERAGEQGRGEGVAGVGLRC